MQSTFKQSLRRPLHPIARWLHRLGVRPNHVSLAGVLAACAAAVCLAADRIGPALIWLAVSLLCDMLDGDIARLDPRRSNPFGAVLDSNVDRISEAVVFGGLLIGQLHSEAGAGRLWLVAWVLAFTGSFMVSYARARSEGLDIPCAVGFAERPERMVVLLAMIIAGWRLSIWFLAALALLTWLTVGQRIAHVAHAVRQSQQETRGEGSDIRGREALGP